jgi:hypothetical protein
MRRWVRRRIRWRWWIRGNSWIRGSFEWEDEWNGICKWDRICEKNEDDGLDGDKDQFEVEVFDEVRVWDKI